MARLLFALVAFAMAMAVIKMVIIALIIAGLIFRTKETLSLLLLLAAWAAFKAHPVLSPSALGLVGVIAAAQAMKRKPDQEEPAKPPPSLE